MHACSFSSCCWITTLVVGGGGNWNIVVKGDLTMRPDGRINSSPLTATTPIVRLQHGCYHELKIPGRVNFNYYSIGIIAL